MNSINLQADNKPLRQGAEACKQSLERFCRQVIEVTAKELGLQVAEAARIIIRELGTPTAALPDTSGMDYSAGKEAVRASQRSHE